MDDRTESEPSVFFRKYADGTIRTDVPAAAESAHLRRDAPARNVNNPWAGELRVTYPKAPAPRETPRSPPTAEPPPPRPRRLASVAAIGAMVCAALIVGLLLPHPGGRRPAAPPAARPQVGAAAPSLEIERPSSARVQPEPKELTIDPAPSDAARADARAPVRVHGAAWPQRIHPSAQDTPVRVFVHIRSGAQLPAANRIRAQLGALRIAGQPVGAPPVRIVARSPRRTELRCLKHADCPAAARLARSLAQSLGTPVAVVDMSPTYEGDPRVRAGSLELWLRP